MRRTATATALLSAALVTTALTPALAKPHAPAERSYAEVRGDRLVVGNALVERTWSLHPFRTLGIVDRRTGRTVAGTSSDGALSVVSGGGTTELPLDSFDADEVAVSTLPDGGRRVDVPLGPVTRIVEIHPDVAGMSLSLVVTAPLTVSGYQLDSVSPSSSRATVAHAFRAGSDWREDGWSPTYVTLGDAQTGDWRADTMIPEGVDRVVSGEWLSAVGDDGGVFQVLERVDLASSTVGMRAGKTWVGVDLSRDLVSTGPLEADVHLGNDTSPAGRQRVLASGTALEQVFTGVARDRDDEGWQWVHYLHGARPSGAWQRGIVFNSDSVDSNRISTGAKDDMDLAEVRRQAAVAKALGVDYFVLDDGWQARSGDWCPDSPECPESRPGKFPARFPDATFAAVREAISPMRLGLWMSPMEFHPQSHAFQDNPEWTCEPIGGAGVGLTVAQNYSSSAEAGLGAWNPLAVSQNGRNIDYIESRIRRAIEQWDVGYFKFDFMWWVDCVGVAPADMYAYREAFTAMLDRIQRDHPDVVVQIDETNDYRLWPFESVARGATWFQNGAPLPPALLHNLWSLAPWVPSDTIGQAALQSGRDSYSIDYLMAVALASHPTVKLDLTKLTPAQVAVARPWVDAYHRSLDHFVGVTYPLLADPATRQWTALQIWDRERQSGVLLAYRQDDAAASTTVQLHSVDGKRYRLRDLLTGAQVAVVSGEQLREGYSVLASAARTAVAVVIDPVPAQR